MQIIHIDTKFIHPSGVTVTGIDITTIVTSIRSKPLASGVNPTLEDFEDEKEVFSYALCSLYTDEGMKTGIPLVSDLRIDIDLSKIDLNATQILIAGVGAEVEKGVIESWHNKTK